MEKEKMKFHITITNNETGETLCNADAGVIIAAIEEGEGKVRQFAACEGSPVALGSTILSAEELVKNLYNRHPELELLNTIFKCGRELKTELEEPKNEE